MNIQIKTRIASKMVFPHVSYRKWNMLLELILLMRQILFF